jgi:hypothetical protein
MVGDGLTCLTFGTCTTKEHIYTKVAEIVRQSRMVGWSHMSHIRACTSKEHIYTKVGIVEDSPG